MIELFKVLSDETRLRILNLIMKQDLCVCELVNILDLPQPKISKHIAKLRSINVVKTQRNEQYIYYSINHENVEYTSILNTVFHLSNPLLQKDLRKLDQIGSFVCSTK